MRTPPRSILASIPRLSRHFQASLPSSRLSQVSAHFSTTMSPASTQNAPGWDLSANPFPTARRSDHKDVYTSAKDGKVEVLDPYVWLEKPSNQDKEVKDWVDAQVTFTQKYIDGYPHRSKFEKSLSDNFSYARFSCPSRKGDGKYYFSYNAGLEPQSRLFVATKEEVDETQGKIGQVPGKPWFDSNLLSDDGTVALSLTSFSEKANLFAYGVSHSGSDWFTVYVRDASKPFVSGPTSESGGPDRLEDKLVNVKFSGITWTHDEKGFFIQTYPDTSHEDRGTETDANKDATMWYHRIGTPQSQDILVIDKDVETPTSMWGANVTNDGKWLLVSNSKDTDTKARLFVAHLQGQEISSQMKWIPVVTTFEYELNYIANDDGRFYFITNAGAPNQKIVYIDLDASSAQSVSHPAQLKGKAELHDLVPEEKDAQLTSASVIAGDRLLLVYSRDVKDELWEYELKTGKKLRRLMPDLVGTISQIAGRREHDEVFVSYISFVNPGSIERISFKDDGSPAKSAPYLSTTVPGIKPDDYASEQVFFNSKDGTRVPMFVTHLKDVKRDGTAPAWVYFYGGFNIPIQPAFSPSMMTWITKYRGILVFVNVRGGGEYGDAWHDAGRLLNKCNVFDDVLAACKFLHENKYAAKGKLILNGGSNGGLGVAACLNRAEEEHGVGAGVAEVGVMDMLKFHTWTIGKAWTADYGNPSEDPAIFDYNYAYSPLHNVQKRVYPTTLIICADHDDRVVPAHSFKLTAELQHTLKENPNPVLLRVDTKAGHGAGKSTQKRIEEAADKYAIVARALGLKMY